MHGGKQHTETPPKRIAWSSVLIASFKMVPLQGAHLAGRGWTRLRSGGYEPAPPRGTGRSRAELRVPGASRPCLCSAEGSSNPLPRARCPDSPLQGVSGLAPPSKGLKICLGPRFLMLVWGQGGSPKLLPHSTNPVRHSFLLGLGAQARSEIVPHIDLIRQQSNLIQCFNPKSHSLF